jgi:alpha-galactosidase
MSNPLKPVGNAAHTKDSSELGLRGEMERPIKITFLGAGSAFTPRLLNDVARIGGGKGGTIALVDIDEGRLAQMDRLIKKLFRSLRMKNWKVVSSPNRRAVMKDSDYVINCIEVSGLGCVRFDNDIPARYGIDQCIGDTVGPGGLFKSLRTIPVWLEVLKDCERFCPEAIILNYTNPMGMMCVAAGRTSSMQVVGLCHSVQGTGALLARRAGVPYEEMAWECAGINHLAWFVKLRHRGVDLYPELIKAARRDLARAFKEGWTDPEDMDDPRKVERPEFQRDLVRKDMMVHFGAFITESSGHLSEYLPYYRKRKDLLERYARPGYDGGSSFYADNWPQWREAHNRDRAAMVSGRKPMAWNRSWEYASWIIEGREKDCPVRIHGNVMNRDEGGGTLISNLPADGCVEVACMVDRGGIHPTRFGNLPAHMAAICASNMHMIGLGTQAAIERSKELAVQALTVDPLSSAVCSPAEIRKMTLEMFRAEKEFLPGYR